MCDSTSTGCFFSSSNNNNNNNTNNNSSSGGGAGNARNRTSNHAGRKENGRSVPDVTASPGRAPPGPLPTNQLQSMATQQQHQQQQQQHQLQQLQQQRQGVKEPVLLQGDFRKVSGISSEIFRQIEAVENDHDPNTAAALEAVERRGEMIVRILEPRCIGGKQAVEAAHKLMAKSDARHSVQLVEIVKRPGQTLGLYIREGNGADRTDGVFISRIALESAVYNSGCLRVGDEILAVNLVDVTHMSLDDVVIIMSIPRRLVLAIRQRRGNRGTSSPGPPTLSRPEQKPPPVVVIKRDLRDEDLDETDHIPRSRSSRERRTGDGREMTESRSRLGLGLNNYSPQSEQLDMYYNSRGGGGGGGGGGVGGGANMINEPPSWGYKPPPPPSVITEQPKSHSFAPSHAYYQNAGTLESLAEKVHSFYPGGPSRRMSAGGGVGLAQQHARFPRSGSDQHLPRIEYADYSASLGRHSLLRSSLKPGGVGGVGGTPGGGGSNALTVGGTLGRYGRYEPQRTTKYGTPGGAGGAQSLTRRSRPTLDYSSDTEATIGPRPSYYYYNRPAIGSMTRGATGAGAGVGGGAGTASVLGGGPDMAKFNSLPRERPGVRLSGIRPRIGERIVDDSDGNLSAPEFTARRERDLRARINASPSIFTSDEYRAWLRRAPSSSAIAEQMRMTRDLLSQPRGHRFSCSAENIHDVLKNTESIYSSRTGVMTGTLDRHLGMPRPISSLPVRSMSSQHIGGPASIRSPSIRRMRQLLELSAGPASPSGSIMSSGGGHQSPAPTPSATLPRTHRQIDINPAEFAKYKLDKPIVEVGGVSGMLWIHLLAGRGLRSTPELGPQPVGGGVQQQLSRDLYCVLECDRVHKARTVVRSGDLQFDWDESFELDLVCNKQLDVLVYSWDPQHRHKLCYRGAISLSSILRQSPLHQLALKVEPRGTIYIRLRHTDPITLYKRRGLPSLRAGYPQLFGADLETVINRESKGAPGSAPVPIVLRRCVEEVERRGLDIIGLYRLCGSATKKRLLREAFERNSRAVELTPEHVPDINVITGVLKDYLRELPEPLFTRCLFQMTVDALGVCLPDDPEGNAKLMLSILDCLPRANRATLVFLLDHLSLVVSASERNKMSAQALATVMGPPLMLHSANAAPGTEIDHAQPIAVLKYLLQIWPQPQQTAAGGPVMMIGAGMHHSASTGLGVSGNIASVNAISGRRGESTGQRGSKVNVLQADKLQSANLLRSASSVTNILSQGQHHLSATNITTTNNRLYQSVVGQLAQSPRALQQAVQQLPQSVVSAGSAIHDQSPLPLPGTPSPGSSSTSTGSGSGSGTDTIKRGASPASVKHVRIHDSPSSYSITSNKHQNQQQQQQQFESQRNIEQNHESHKTSTSNNGRDSLDKSNRIQHNATTPANSINNNNCYGPTATATNKLLETPQYTSIRNKSSNPSSSSSSAATVLSAGSTTASGATTSSDDSDDLISSYKTSAATNALLAQSQALTTTQLMSKYLKREPRVAFTPIKSPTTPSPPNEGSGGGGGGGGSGSGGGLTSALKGSYNYVPQSALKSKSAGGVGGGGGGAAAAAAGDDSSRYRHHSTAPTGTGGGENGSASNGKYNNSRTTTAAASASSSSSSSSSSNKVSSPSRQISKISHNNSARHAASSHTYGSDTDTHSNTTTTTTSTTTTTTINSTKTNNSYLSNKNPTYASPDRSFHQQSSSSSGAASNVYSNTSTATASFIGANGGGMGSSNNGPTTASATAANHHHHNQHSSMNFYGTLPKHSGSGSSGGGYASGNGSSAITANTNAANPSSLLSSTAPSYLTGNGASHNSSNSSSGVAGSNYDFYTNSRPFGNGDRGTSSGAGTGTGNGNHYHTLGSYRVQYSSTNPFLESFDPPSSSSQQQQQQQSSSTTSDRSSAIAAFHTGKSASDEYDDLK